ncbi:uncharacterized protein LOC100178402 [Ciona intestinalis]
MNGILGTTLLTSIYVLAHSVCYGQVAAPENISVDKVGSTGFTVSFNGVPIAANYQVKVTAQHDSSDSEIFTIRASSNARQSYQIKGRKSNRNYIVQVRALDTRNTASNYTTETGPYARTAPDGSRILNVITTPTFLTIFLEETPGATAWEVEVNDTITGTSRIISVPNDVPSNTSYVAIITPLNPNTPHTLRARVSQLNGATSFTATQSPFGAQYSVSTDKISAFGRVVLLTKPYTTSLATDQVFINQTNAELLAAYKAISSNVEDVLMVEIQNNSGNVLYHHEIVLSDRDASAASVNPNINRLTLNDGTLYSGFLAAYDLARSPGYVYTNFPFKTTTRTLSYRNSGLLCSPVHLADDIREWVLFSQVPSPDKIATILRGADGLIATSSIIEFLNGGVREPSSTTNYFTFSSNTIYGIKHRYSIKLCSSSNTAAPVYDRVYEAVVTSAASDRYTIFYTTAPVLPSSSVSSAVITSGGINVVLPASLARATQYSVTVGTNTATLAQTDLDSSPSYQISVPTPTIKLGDFVHLQIKATVRLANGFSATAIQSANITADIDKCLPGTHNCHVNAICANINGNSTCFCTTGYTGDGVNCTYIDKCALGAHNCNTSATCSTTTGSFTCSCKTGFNGNGVLCTDIDECTLGTHNCINGLKCRNTNGDFTCYSSATAPKLSIIVGIGTFLYITMLLL